MVAAGERLTMTGNGPRELRFLATGAETAGELLAMEALYPPQTSYPPEHRHPEQEERFTILSGALTVRLDGEVRRYAAGESVVIPRGIAHTMHNAEPGETYVRWEVRPALRTAEFFAALAAGEPGAGKVATLAHQMSVLRAFRREMVLTKPPVAVQRALFAALALLDGRGRLAIHEDVIIAHPAAEIFAYVSDQTHDPDWRTGVTALTQSTGGQVRVGTITKETLRTFGQQIVMTGRIVAVEPGRLVAFTSIDGPIPVHGHRRVEATPAGTRLTYYLAAELSGFYRLLGPILERDLRGKVRGDLRRLQARFEGRS